MFTKTNENVRKAQERRCSGRRTRPPLNTFPPYFGETFSTRQYEFTDGSSNNRSGLMSDTVSVILLPGAFDQPGTALDKINLNQLQVSCERNIHSTISSKDICGIRRLVVKE